MPGKTFCGNCGRDLAEFAAEVERLAPCPDCGSTDRDVSVTPETIATKVMIPTLAVQTLNLPFLASESAVYPPTLTLVSPSVESLSDEALLEEVASILTSPFLLSMQRQPKHDDPYTLFAHDPATGRLLAWASHTSRLGASYKLIAKLFPD